MAYVAGYRPFNEAELAELKRLVEEEVEKQLSVALKKQEKIPSQSWNPITLLKNFFYPTEKPQQTNKTTSTPTNPEPVAPIWPIPPIAAQLFDEFITAYPHYNLDPWEFDFGLLATYQMLRDQDGVLVSHVMDTYVGMMPTYRHLYEQAKAGKRAEPPYYILYLEGVAGAMGYDEGVINAEKLRSFLASAEGQEIRRAFRGYRDECFGVEDAGREYGADGRPVRGTGSGRL